MTPMGKSEFVVTHSQRSNGMERQNLMMTLVGTVAALALVMFGAPGFAQTEAPKPAPADAKPETKPAAAGKANPKVVIETTLGNITLELDAAKAPISTENFLQYAKDKFYDGTIFHRVMPNFMIQGGGHLPNLDEKKEGIRPPIKNEWQNGLKNVRGTIAMARTNAADSATAQFFINVVDNANLDQAGGGGAGYAVFGKVVEGMDVVDKIKDTETKVDPKYPGGKVVPATPVVIKSVRVAGDGAAAPAQPGK